MNSWPISWWKFTGEYGPWEDRHNGAVRSCSPILASISTGERLSLNDLPWGACYVGNMDAETLELHPSKYSGADGLSIVCITPRTTPPDRANPGQWYIDSRANNCDRKDDWTHRCWVRKGTVGDPLHIDKDGLTCGAGAGSIQNAGWHGFLHHGVLHE